MFKRTKVCTAALVALGGAVAATSLPTFAQDRVEITGSRIKRTDVEGPSPISVVSRAELDAAGEISVADFLRNNVYNSFGSAREASGSATGSQATVSMRGLGSEYTLVLLDGRRITPSGALSGASANINMIPTSAIERIEILREGAAAIYGSDAIAGVINIITKKDQQGGSITIGFEDPKTGPEGKTAGVSFGINSDKGNLTFVWDHQDRGMMYNREIGDLWRAAAPRSSWASAFNSSANFFSPQTGLVGVAGCNQYPNSEQDGGLCRFVHGNTSANEASLRRNALLVNGNYNLTDDISLFFRGLNSETQSMGVYAAAPVDTFPTISANNPFNPFGVDGTLYYRFTPLGTRDSHRKDTIRDYTLGVRGSANVLGGLDWELAVGGGKSAQASINYNYGIGTTLQALIDANQYNPFDPTHPSVAAAAPSVGHTVFVESTTSTSGIDGSVSFQPFKIGSRSVGFVAGFEARKDMLNQTYDAQSAAGNVFGSAGAGSIGRREYNAVYAEMLFPLMDKLNLTIAGRQDDYDDVGSKFSPRVSLEFRPIDSLILRGSAGKGFRAPSLADLYQAPSTTNLNSPPDASIPHQGGDELACNALRTYRTANNDPTYQPYPVDPCATNGQYQWVISSNRFLKPEESRNYNIGLVFSPTPDFSVSLDYFDIEVTNIITSVPRALAFRYGDQGLAGYGVTRSAPIVTPANTQLPGVPQSILLPVDNGAVQTSKGLDLEVNYRLRTASIGQFGVQLNWAHTLEFNFTPKIGGMQERAGRANYPEDRALLGLSWGMGGFNAVLNTNYISKHSNGTAATTVPEHVTYDLQVSYATPWKGRLTAGVRNLTDKLPPFRSALWGFPYYDNTLYNIYGRTPYVRYEQNF
ncbi:MAG: TonB-dependent receptor [Rubrivivax sp.]|nr:TonB-dependent receptor [Rubrivivax sp.]